MDGLAALQYELGKPDGLATLHQELGSLLRSSVTAFDLRGGVLYLICQTDGALQPIAAAGTEPEDVPGSLLELAGQSLAPDGVYAGQLFLPRGSGRRDVPHPAWVARLGPASEPIGRLVLWARPSRNPPAQRMQIAVALAHQMTLLATYHQRVLQAGNQAILDERARLCRELHDGVAQTLSYLKLRADQVAGWLESNEQEKASAAVREIQGVLAELYEDAREALDGLGQNGEDGHINAWFAPVIAAFEERSGIQVAADEIPDVMLPASMTAQLQRIVQEALCNIRKHSGATQARLEWQTTGADLLVRIMDDGCGFDPDLKALRSSQHGLRSMRERAALLEADLRIDSAPGRGARISLKIPIPTNGHGNGHG